MAVLDNIEKVYFATSVDELSESHPYTPTGIVNTYFSRLHKGIRMRLEKWMMTLYNVIETRHGNNFNAKTGIFWEQKNGHVRPRPFRSNVLY
jgi:hypothetical protein